MRWFLFRSFFPFLFLPFFLADWLTAEITVGGRGWGGRGGGEGIEVAVTRTAIYNYRCIYNKFLKNFLLGSSLLFLFGL